jgi:hypothetical protein
MARHKDKPVTVIFLHIPKTAGTTFNSILSWLYLGRPSYWISPDDLHASEFKALPVASRSCLELLRGHMYFGLHEYLAQPATYITFLRKPIARVLSYYSNALAEAAYHTGKSHWFLDAVRSMSFEEFIDCGKDKELENGQVRRISGIGFRPRPCTTQDLELAKTNLDRFFSVVGLSHRFDESLALMRRQFKWTRFFAYQREKVSAKPIRPCDVSPYVLAKLEEMNALDEELVTYAQHRFEKQCLQEGHAVALEVRRIRFLNGVLRPFIPLARRLVTAHLKRLGVAQR